MIDIIVKHYSGSYAYGTNIEGSDVDFRGIFIGNKESIITPFDEFKIDEYVDKNEEDTKYFELSKYLKLYCSGNPTVIETLWIDPSDIVFTSDEYELLTKYRYDLLSSKIAMAYTSYASSQTNRMDNHHNWMNKERKSINKIQNIIDTKLYNTTLKEWILDAFPDYITKHLNFENIVFDGIDVNYNMLMRDIDLQMVSTKNPTHGHYIKLIHNYMPSKILNSEFTIYDYNEDHQLVSYGSDMYGVIRVEGESILTSDGVMRIKEHDGNNSKILPELIIKFNKQEYKQLTNLRNNYKSWKQNRNVIRGENEEKYGYDTKHAMHTIRLLRTAEEVLTNGVIRVKRPDANELLDIRYGKWSYDELMAYYKDKCDYILNTLYPKTSLPPEPNIKLASKILMDLYETSWYK